MRTILLLMAGLLMMSMHAKVAPAAPAPDAKPLLRPLPVTPPRPMADGPGYFVHPVKGDDALPGSEEAPWRTLGHAMTQLSAGDTLYLRGGTYFESLTCAIAGTPEAPITIRSYPGEQAIIDASLPEFQHAPATAWEPVADGAPGEYRSTTAYKNIRDVLGYFGDSLIGLQSYWYLEDLRADNELWITSAGGAFNPLPVYCGPGIWYDKQTGRIHARLAHTNILPEQIENYRGETDPRKLPLIIAPFGARALFVDQAMHVRFQDLILRGGGHDTVVLQQGIDLDFDNVTIYAGTYGLRARGTGPLKFVNSAIHGNIPPWAFRIENSLRGAGPGHSTPFIVPEDQHPPRNVARLNTHAVLVTEGSYEFEVFYYPHNHDWEIAHSEFTDGHDGVYLSGHNIRFHHNYVHHFQDDSVYLSTPSPYFTDNVQIYQNYFSHVGMPFGGHTRGGPDGDVYIYRNVCDQRAGVNWSRPSDKNPEGDIKANLPLVVHGRKFLGSESWYFYHNLFIGPSHNYGFHQLLKRNSPTTSRWVLNNIFVYLDDYPHVARAATEPVTSDVVLDGNLHWSVAPDAKPKPNYLENLRTHERGAFADRYPHAWATHSQVANPGFATLTADEDAANDYRVKEGSPAIGTAVPLPEFLPDVVSREGGAAPDLGPAPAGTQALPVGRFGRIDALRPPAAE